MGQGIKVSQLGFDAPDTGDQNLLFSSGWPLLKIEATGTLTVDGSSDRDIYEHDLGYPPFFLIFQVNDLNPSSDSLVFYSAGSTFLKGPRQHQSDPKFYVTNNKLAMEGAGDGTLPLLNLKWYICRLPIDQPFKAPIYNLSDEAAAKRDSDIGIKILKPNASTNSKDLRDYTLHSGTRSPQVHSVTTGALQQVGVNDFELTWVNDLGYAPLYFAFARNDIILPQEAGKWFGPVNLTPLTFGTSGNLTAFDITNQSYASIIVFKDPFLTPNIQQVTV